MRIACLITSHNRKDKTISCLRALFDSTYASAISAVLVDDGSSDGTAEAVTAEFPQVSVLRGDGSLYWARGMHLAQSFAVAELDPDYVLWLNDDTMLLPGAICSLVDAALALEAQSGRAAVMVGSIVGTDTERLTYGGAVATSRLRRFSYRLVSSATEAVECDVMNGNLVLIPRVIVDALGNIDSEYEHAMGDTDYALRAKRAGFKVFVAPGRLGRCDRNPAPGVDYFTSHSLREKWAAFTSRKRLPPRSWLRFTRRHGGLLWPVYFSQPYAKYVFQSIKYSLIDQVSWVGRQE